MTGPLGPQDVCRQHRRRTEAEAARPVRQARVVAVAAPCGAWIDPAAAFTFENGVSGDQRAVLEDADLVDVVLNFHDALPGRVGDAVEIAVDRDHTLVAHASLYGQDSAVGDRRQRRQARPFLGEGLVDGAPRGGMDPWVGDGGAPAVELGVQIVEVAEGPGEEEVLPDIAERPLDLSFRLGPIRAARPRDGAIMVQQRHEGSVVGDDPRVVLADHRRLHAVVEDFLGHAAYRLERRHMAAQDRLEVLAGDEATPEPPAVAEDDREQPDLARNIGLVGERHRELREVDLRLATRRRLEAALEPYARRRADLPQEIGHPRVSALITHLPDLPQQPGPAEIGEGHDTFAQIVLVGIEQALAGLPRPIDRAFQAALEILPDGLAVASDLPRDRGKAQPLLLQIVDQDDLPQSMHPSAPVPSFGASGQHPAASPISG